MALLVVPLLLLTVIAGVVTLSNRRITSQGSDEEFVHAAALLRRETAGAERRREPRHEVKRACTVCILGEETTRTSCRILDVSRSGMRITSEAEFPENSQVIVEWGREFFVGTVCYGFPKDGEHVYGLQLVSTNCEK
jgi:hypothetical protein